MDAKALLAAMYEAVDRPKAEDEWTQIYPSCVEGDVDLIFKRAAAVVLRVVGDELTRGNGDNFDLLAEDYLALAKDFDASRP